MKQMTQQVMSKESKAGNIKISRYKKQETKSKNQETKKIQNLNKT
jgi:hypothetical protein